MTQQHQDTTQYDQDRRLHVQTALPQEKQHAYSQAMKILTSNVRCEVILPGKAAYEAERKVWNGTFDRYPAVIVRCVDADDVRAAINFAREQALRSLCGAGDIV